MVSTPDGVDRLLLAQAGRYLGRRTVVFDDRTGHLTLGLPGVVGTCCDGLDDRRRVAAAVAANPVDVAVWSWPEPALLQDAELVVARLPKGHRALAELAARVAAVASPSVVLLAAGRVKHMDRGMNDVLARHFIDVRASLGQYKARALVATGPHRDSRSNGASADDAPVWARHDDLDLTVCAYGSTFAGTGVDPGTRLLLTCSGRWPREAREVVDLGCGSGVLAVAAARELPHATVSALDLSAAAVASARTTAAANGLADRITAVQADGLSEVDPDSLDLVLCNPPFHRGTARDADTAATLFAQAGTRLRVGGELWVVWNSHLPYLPWLRQRVGSTSVVAQNPRFTVTRSVRRR